jgi:segregation and condensation protein B
MQTAKEKQEKTINSEHLADILLAIIFASGDPVSKYHLRNRLNLPEREFNVAIECAHEKIADMPFFLYDNGISYQLISKPEFGGYVRLFVSHSSMALSEEAQGVLAYIAYNQPVKKAQIDEVRGKIDSEKVLNTLKKQELIMGIRKEDEPGCPAVYMTTEVFLKRFGLKSLMDLPTIK